ncbi:hypothetical protein E4T56_gene1225 [Termitomyces sp. T112]|nr:hypothetical protein E4T56_gene1225 [Termitomyces sp. T112]
MSHCPQTSDSVTANLGASLLPRHDSWPEASGHWHAKCKYILNRIHASGVEVRASRTSGLTCLTRLHGIQLVAGLFS